MSINQYFNSFRDYNPGPEKTSTIADSITFSPRTIKGTSMLHWPSEQQLKPKKSKAKIQQMQSDFAGRMRDDIKKRRLRTVFFE
jgi:hypothetical protein